MLLRFVEAYSTQMKYIETEVWIYAPKLELFWYPTITRCYITCTPAIYYGLFEFRWLTYTKYHARMSNLLLRCLYEEFYQSSALL